MAHSTDNSERFWSSFFGPNMGYIEEQYELFKENPEEVDASIRDLFNKHGAPRILGQVRNETTANDHGLSLDQAIKLSSAIKYAEAIRRYGHLEADIYAVGGWDQTTNLLNPDTYDITDEDLVQIPAKWLWDKAPAHAETGYDVIKILRKRYTGKISFEYDHVNSDEERHWISDQIESGDYKAKLSDDEKTGLLNRLVEVEGFEHFLQKTFVGQKRFSIEGLESMIPILDKIVELANEEKIENVMMGMAHRGRLSVLAHVLGKPLDKIFSEFHYGPDKTLIPSHGSQGIYYGWTGDVKYHFGAVKDYKNANNTPTRLSLAHNPSHLEFVNPVVTGRARAVQDDRTKVGYPTSDIKKAMSVLIHGDAAFIGEGIVPESLNLGGLKGYRTGGSMHIIANNLVGFTTDRKEGRSTRYASDLAKGYEIPIIRVNADDPIACVSAARLAFKYMAKFEKDCLIDLVGYRRYGHNEMDEPRSTQPELYKEIDQHPTVTKIYADRLTEDSVIKEESYEAFKEKTQEKLQEIYNSMTEDNLVGMSEVKMPNVLVKSIDDYETAVPLEKLRKLNEEMLELPEGFNRFKRLDRVFNRRKTMLDEGNKADWGAGEALAYASIISDGIPIRITGQDSERGTFAHRNLVLYDVETNDKYCLMHGIKDAKASFDIHNSPLSETAVLGFEYGYSVQSPETLVIWEAQFGDFVNVAQVMLDQFISSARAKWGEKSNMVMLLPHGYEGQGPEHSSARLERFLQMAGENNLIVANVTSAAQFFHLLRRQAKMQDKEEARPLVVMSPKSLLRDQRVASEPEEFAEGKFLPIRNQPNLKVSKKNATRLLLGTGKVMVDIESAIVDSDEKFDWLRALRIEQLYPFPKEQLIEELKQLPNLEEVVWVQEEPQNMGGWLFVLEELREIVAKGIPIRYVGQPDRASTSVGDPNIHKLIQDRVIKDAINPTKGGNNSEGN